jgi:hypothetical protein
LARFYNLFAIGEGGQCRLWVIRVDSAPSAAGPILLRLLPLMWLQTDSFVSFVCQRLRTPWQRAEWPLDDDHRPRRPRARLQFVAEWL